MTSVFRLIVKGRDRLHADGEELSLADFGGVVPMAGDLYVRNSGESEGSENVKVVFRVLCRALKENRVTILLERADDLPADLINALAAEDDGPYSDGREMVILGKGGC